MACDVLIYSFCINRAFSVLKKTLPIPKTWNTSAELNPERSINLLSLVFPTCLYVRVQMKVCAAEVSYSAVVHWRNFCFCTLIFFSRFILFNLFLFFWASFFWCHIYYVSFEHTSQLPPNSGFSPVHFLRWSVSFYLTCLTTWGLALASYIT